MKKSEQYDTLVSLIKYLYEHDENKNVTGDYAEGLNGGKHIAYESLLKEINRLDKEK